jgi:hypothetical protein
MLPYACVFAMAFAPAIANTQADRIGPEYTLEIK